MPATRAQSARPRQRYSPVAVSPPAENDVIVLSSDDEQPPRTRAPTPRRKRSKQKNRAPIPATADIVEISSGEEDIVVTRARLPPRRQPDALAMLQRQLKEAQEEVEQLRKEARAAEKQKAAPAAPVDPKMLEELEESVTCEICTLKMWAPYALPCGHTFCKTCLQDWFGTTQAQHLNNYPQAAGGVAGLDALYRAIRHPLTPAARRGQALLQIEQIEAQYPPPKYTCPTCRTECTTRPTEVFVIKSIVERIAKAQGEAAPQNAPVRTRAGQARLITGPFDGFFSERAW